MRYRTPAALEMAVKAAAKASPLDTNLAISGFNFYRLLCRVFSEKDRKFALKGGLSVLARTVDARASRDIDLLAQETELGAAVEELRRLASVDLGDFMAFRFDKAEPIKSDDECRSRLSSPWRGWPDIAMCDQDDAWGESRHFSERNMAELYTEEPAPSPSSGRGPEEWQWPGRRSWRASTLQTKWTRPRIGADIRS